MTRDDIIKMAREAGSIDSEEVIETVWNAFSAAEREACARVCDETTAAWTQAIYNSACVDCATAIRNRAEGRQ